MSCWCSAAGIPEPKICVVISSLRLFSGPFSVIEEIEAARLSRMLPTVLHLSGPKTQFFFPLQPAFLTGQRSCSPFAPVVFDGNKKQGEAAQNG